MTYYDFRVDEARYRTPSQATIGGLPGTVEFRRHDDGFYETYYGYPFDDAKAAIRSQLTLDLIRVCGVPCLETKYLKGQRKHWLMFAARNDLLVLDNVETASEDTLYPLSETKSIYPAVGLIAMICGQSDVRICLKSLGLLVQDDETIQVTSLKPPRHTMELVDIAGMVAEQTCQKQMFSGLNAFIQLSEQALRAITHSDLACTALSTQERTEWLAELLSKQRAAAKQRSAYNRPAPLTVLGLMREPTGPVIEHRTLGDQKEDASTPPVQVPTSTFGAGGSGSGT